MGYSGFKSRYGGYHVEELKRDTYSADELRKEYQRLYRVAQKRLRRFESAGRTDAEAYRLNRGMAASVELRDQDLPYALDEVYRFLSNERGSVTGLRRWEKELVESLHDVGLDFVNTKNLQAFGDYMDYVRAQHLDKVYGSERLVQLWGAAVKKGLDTTDLHADFEFWMKHTEELERAPKHRNAKQRTLATYRQEIEDAERRKAKRSRKRRS